MGSISSNQWRLHRELQFRSLCFSDFLSLAPLLREATALVLCRAQDLPQIKSPGAARTPFPRSEFLPSQLFMEPAWLGQMSCNLSWIFLPKLLPSSLHQVLSRETIFPILLLHALHARGFCVANVFAQTREKAELYGHCPGCQCLHAWREAMT